MECTGCQLIRLDPWPAPSLLGRYYPDSYWYTPADTASGRLTEAYRRWVVSDHVRFVETALAAAGAGEGLVLDVGCGGGLFLRLLRERGRRVMGLDLSWQAASLAWHRNGVPAAAAQLRKAPLRPGSCRAITMFHVLEHLYDPASYLDAARELLHPEGRLVVQVPNAASWQFLLFGENWNGLDVPRHLVDFRAADLDLLLDNCGFEPVRHKHFSLRDNPAGFASSLAPSLDPMARRVRGLKESAAGAWVKDLTYFALLLAAVPFAAFEAACGRGATVMVEARRK